MERVRYNRAHDSVTAAKKPFGSSPEESRRYSVGDFLALLAFAGMTEPYMWYAHLIGPDQASLYTAAIFLHS